MTQETNNACDCGGEKTNTPHSDWCSSLLPPEDSETLTLKKLKKTNKVKKDKITIEVWDKDIGLVETEDDGCCEYDI